MAETQVIDAIGKSLEQIPADIPLYKRLKLAIEQAIQTRAFQAGSVLPGERVIATSFSLSRVTVRKALSLLEDEGLLSRRHGFKTEIGSRVEKSLSTLTSFSEDIRARGQVPGCIWISKQVSRASSTEMMALGVAGNANVIRMKRVRTANGLPIALETSIVPVRFVPTPDLIDQSLYEVLQERGFMPERAIQRMRSRAATAEDAGHLHCEAGSPLLVTERRCFTADGQIVEVCETRYKGEVYDFVFELQR
ncbi:GntR family transcriptional regulator [Rhizobium cauense]|uniref:GntR family transcriptional regulator n=1 Tax=Rhizobium cauense TaxID=1166683 RepID=UPI001C6E3099|nr:GntR family transcriptional regulator [Rhizobium cauense]MBW9118037.1 GntR family transcriptional regulator [Rhizobium cauense]